VANPEALGEEKLTIEPQRLGQALMPALALSRQGAHVLRDLNMGISPAYREALSHLSCSEFLNLSLCDLRKDAPPIENPLRRTLPLDWTFKDAEFGGEVALTLVGVGPSSLRVPAFGLRERFLGVRWTPWNAARRIVHTSFVWERLEGRAESLMPTYMVTLHRDGRHWPAPRMWRAPDPDSTLAVLPAGATARHEVDWFFGEWLPDGDYGIEIEMHSAGSSLPRTDPAGAARHEYSILAGTIHLRFSTED